MFGKKKNKASAQSARSTGAPEAFDVHTMADDIARGAAGTAAPVSGSAPTAPQPQQQPQDTAAVASPSPFLAETQKSAPAARQQSAMPAATEQKKPSQQSVSQNTAPQAAQQKKSTGLAWLLLAIFVGILGVLVWFVWSSGLAQGIVGRFASQQTTRIVTQNSGPHIPEDVPETTPQDAERVKTVELYDYNDARFPQATKSIAVTSQAISPDITQKLKEIVSIQEGPMEEIIGVFDENNAPLPFAVFAKRFLPQLPTAMLTALDQPFQIYILPQQNGLRRVGIHTYSSQPEQTRDALRMYETTLPRGLSPLFLFAPPQVQNAVFDDSDYKNIPIRFYNFTPDASESIDYATHYDHVFLGTSRAVLRRMMDMVFAYDATVQDAATTQGVQPLLLQGDDSAAARVVAPATGAGGSMEGATDAPTATENAQGALQ